VNVADTEDTNYRSILTMQLAHKENLPTLPTLVLNIREALDSPSLSAVTLSKLIERDADLSGVLMRYASSVMTHSKMQPQDIFDTVRILGMLQVDRIAIIHSMRMLFSGHTQAYTKVFASSWDRMVQKAATSAFIAKKVGGVVSDKALLGSLLSEVGTLMVLSNFKERDMPSTEIFITLCREFAKNMGLALLERWDMVDEYGRLNREVGNWHAAEDEPLGLIDIVNLGLYHSLKARMTAHRLPAISSLIAYQKLPEEFQAVTDTNELEIVVLGRDNIRAIADSLY
jgi:HD-like signal output (HDOD) protein